MSQLWVAVVPSPLLSHVPMAMSAAVVDVIPGSKQFDGVALANFFSPSEIDSFSPCLEFNSCTFLPPASSPSVLTVDGLDITQMPA